MTRITSAGGDLQPLAPPDIVSPDRYALNAISDDPTMEFLDATRLSRSYFITRSLARPNIGAKSAIASISGSMGGLAAKRRYAALR
jgi:hypothetical protein